MAVISVQDLAEQLRVSTLSRQIMAELAHAGEGHCVRIDYLDRPEAEAVCSWLRLEPDGRGRIQAYVLTGSDDEGRDPLAIRTDRAIELRNRKRDRLCLFVPADLVDATISSLGNSFAQLDGRELHRQALEVILGDLDAETAEQVRGVRTYLRGSAVSYGQLLDLVLQAKALEERGDLGRLGRELWRVGLLPDSRDDFGTHLSGNLKSVRKLAGPASLTASYRDRVASLKVDDGTARRLEVFFAGRPMHDVQTWARELGDAALTFDTWTFPEKVETDLETVRVRPFTDAKGDVLKTTKLSQPDGPGGTLFAQCGPKGTMTVQWDTEPLKPRNVHAWRVAIEPTTDNDELVEDDVLFDLPSREIKGSLKKTSLKLDLQFDDPPETSMRVHVTAVDEAGDEITRGDGAAITDLSEEFYLTNREEPPEVRGATRRHTVPTLAFGRLEAALETVGDTVELQQPLWSVAREALYFSMRANDRTILNVAVSSLLRDLERQTISQPRSGGRFSLQLDEVRPATLDEIEVAPSEWGKAAEWNDFWQARRSFFDRLRRGDPRDVLAAAEWTTELTNSALSHARAYHALLATLAEEANTPARQQILRDALSVDTLSISIEAGDEREDAVVVLPTHPLRALWHASHAALLREWEERILQHPRKDRRSLVDLHTIRELVPANLPAFVPVADGREPLVFFQNLGLFCGVALPAAAPDPRRRTLDVAQVVGLESEIQDVVDDRPDRLSRYLKSFLESHPYADPLDVTLVNPDRGEFFASAVGQLVTHAGSQDEDAEPPIVPSCNVRTYVVDESLGAMKGLDRLRSLHQEHATRRSTDALQPSVASVVRPLAVLDDEPPEDAHLAIVSDTSRPTIAPSSDTLSAGLDGSFSLYGLLTRFVGTFEADDRGATWNYRILTAPGEKFEPHPSGARFSDTLIEAQRRYLRGIGRLLAADGPGVLIPGLRVHLDRASMKTLEHVHDRTDWVVTVDRFLGVEFYDSPGNPTLASVADKYLIDYTPEFSEGLGHRMIVTTSRRDEVAMILSRAMDDLGFMNVEGSVGALLGHLKTVSGRLALQALSRASNGAAAVSLAAVTAWLRGRGRLAQAILVPIDLHRDLFWPGGAGPIGEGDRRCDLALFQLKRNIVEVTFMEVKSRRGALGNLDDLADDMHLQMESTARTVEDRFFNLDRVDGALQRSRLGNVLRFYLARGLRYGLMDADVAQTCTGYLAKLEKPGLEFRLQHEGFVVSLDSPARAPVVIEDTTVRVLTAQDFA